MPCNCKREHKGTCTRCLKKDPLPADYQCGSKCEEPCKVPLEVECNNPENYSAKDVRYKADCDEIGFSKLQDLGISKGDDLEFIIERFGHILKNLDYHQDPQVEGHPELDSFDKIVVYLLKKIDDLHFQLCSFEQKQQDLDNKISQLSARVNTLEYPQLVDTHAIGFTKFDGLLNVLQTLINKN